MARIEIPDGEGNEMSRVWSIAPPYGRRDTCFKQSSL